MLKSVKVTLLGKKVTITKLSAHNALRAHGKVLRFIAPAVGNIADGMGKGDEAQAEQLSSAITNAVGNAQDMEEIITFIDECITGGDVVLDGNRVTHLDDLEIFEDVDGSELMYAIFAEWVKLNLGGLIKKIGGQLAG